MKNGSDYRSKPRRTWFKKGNQNAKGFGRPRLTPEEREQRREAKRVAREVALGNMQIDMLCRQHAPLAVRSLVEILRNGAEPAEKIKAAAELLNRGFGKPTETQIVAAAVGLGVNVNAVNAVEEAKAVLCELFARPAPRVLDHEPA